MYIERWAVYLSSYMPLYSLILTIFYPLTECIIFGMCVMAFVRTTHKLEYGLIGFSAFIFVLRFIIEAAYNHIRQQNLKVIAWYVSAWTEIPSVVLYVIGFSLLAFSLSKRHYAAGIKPPPLP